MKDLTEKITNGGVQKITNLKQLGGSKSSGKGSFPRWNHMCDPDYAEKFNKIFKKSDSDKQD